MTDGKIPPVVVNSLETTKPSLPASNVAATRPSGSLQAEVLLGLTSQSTDTPLTESTVLSKEFVQQLNDYVQIAQRDIKFSVDEGSGSTVVSVYDGNTEELIRQIPSEELLRISAALREQLDDRRGLIIESQA